MTEANHRSSRVQAVLRDRPAGPQLPFNWPVGNYKVIHELPQIMPSYQRHGSW